MPKIPTFKAQGSITQLAGTTSNIQMNLNNTLASALSPITKTIVNQKIKEISNYLIKCTIETHIVDLHSITATTIDAYQHQNS